MKVNGVMSYACSREQELFDTYKYLNKKFCVKHRGSSQNHSAVGRTMTTMEVGASLKPHQCYLLAGRGLEGSSDPEFLLLCALLFGAQK